MLVSQAPDGSQGEERQVRGGRATRPGESGWPRPHRGRRSQWHPGHRSGGCGKPSVLWLVCRLADFQSKWSGCAGERCSGSGNCQEPECGSYSEHCRAVLSGSGNRPRRPSPVGLTQELA